MKKTQVVIFDFDRTLSAKDSNTEFMKYCLSHSLRPWLFLPLMAIAGVASFFKPSGIWWRENLRRFLTPKMIKKFVPDFVKKHLKNRFPWAKKRVAAEKKNGRRVLLISASPNYLIPKLVKDMDFDAVLCSQLKPEIPWKYDFLCRGKNKVVALNNWAKENKIVPVVVRTYTDSKTDMPIMNLAKEKIWINSKTGQRK